MYSYNYDTIKVITSMDGNKQYSYFFVHVYMLTFYLLYIFRNARSIPIV